ncbi:MAG: aldehyde dehydrogenase family protein [Myxococcaceae bacterium]
MTAVAIPSSTETSALDKVVARVKDGAATFARLSLRERLLLLEQLRRGYHEIAEQSVVLACQAKGLDPNSSVAGEEWLAGPMPVLRNLRLLIESLQDIERIGVPNIDPKWISKLPDGRITVRVYPTNALDAALLGKTTAEVHMQQGITAENLREHQASFYRKPHPGKLCVVLGAGNVNAIPPTDVLQKLFAEGTVCVLKMNPVNAYIGPLLERAFRAAIDRGFLAVVYGGAEEGAHLVNHPLIDEVHITGSDKTHDTLVWGPPGADREARKKRKEPLLKKEISSELGNISPVLIVPGPYSAAELDSQSAHIAGMVANNASFNCNAAKLLVTPQGFAQQESLIAGIERGLARAPVRKAYYPGAEDRWKQLTDGRAGLKLVGKAGAGELPYALIPNVDPSQTNDRVFQHEPWCTVLSQMNLSAANPVAYVEQAVSFLNDKVWGTLCATLVVHPMTAADSQLGPAIERAIRELRYGTVAINTWPAVAFALMSTPWGGHPSATLENIQSGLGFVHNTFMLEGIEKCVVRGPVRPAPVNPWFAGHRTLDKLGRRLVEMEWNPSWLKLPAIAAAALGA